jgi:hydrogenase nickel incorporation protein HypA/HybF
MHELSIATAIAEIAERHAAGRRVRRVDVQVGHLRQVVPDSLHFAFALVSEGSALDCAELVIDHVQARARCRACGAESVLQELPLTCRACGGGDLELLTGEELQVVGLELEAQPQHEERTGDATVAGVPELER